MIEAFNELLKNLNDLIDSHDCFEIDFGGITTSEILFFEPDVYLPQYQYHISRHWPELGPYIPIIAQLSKENPHFSLVMAKQVYELDSTLCRQQKMKMRKPQMHLVFDSDLVTTR